MDAKEFFTNLHDIEVNQKYAKNLPYSFHLELVEKQALKFEKYILSEKRDITFTGIWGHDSIEDARLTYNDVKSKFGKEVAEIIYLCTENKGRNREARKDEVWYNELAQNDIAVFVKLCDIIANSLFSLTTGSTMFEKYKNEYYNKVKQYLYPKYKNRYADMFEYLEKIYNV